MWGLRFFGRQMWGPGIKNKKGGEKPTTSKLFRFGNTNNIINFYFKPCNHNFKLKVFEESLRLNTYTAFCERDVQVIKEL